MKSEALRAWLRALPAPKSSFFAPISEVGYGGVHHLQNLILFKKRLAEAPSDAEREVLLKLLADEEAKEPSAQLMEGGLT